MIDVLTTKSIYFKSKAYLKGALEARAHAFQRRHDGHLLLHVPELHDEPPVTRLQVQQASIRGGSEDLLHSQALAKMVQKAYGT